MKNKKPLIKIASFTALTFMLVGCGVSPEASSSISSSSSIETTSEESSSSSRPASYSFSYILSEDGTSYAINGCQTTGQVDVVVPATFNDIPVTKIRQRAFYNRANIHSIVLPDTMEYIGYEAFAYCSELKFINIPDSIKELDGTAFNACDALEFTIKDDLCYIGNEDNPYKVLVKTAEGNLTSYTINEGCEFVSSSVFIERDDVTSISMPNTVKAIGTWAFQNCTALTNINLSTSLTKLERIFSGCTSLTNLVVPEGVTEIYTNTFYGCTALTTITLPDSLISLGDEAFYNCSSLKALTIPNNVTYIGFNSLYNCSALEILTVPYIGVTPTEGNDITNWFYYEKYSRSPGMVPGSFTLVLSQGIELIPARCCSGVDAISGLVLPETVKEIGQSAFSGTGLKTLNLPEGLTTIRTQAFYGCTNLYKLSLPSSLTTIENEAFSQCLILASVINKSSLKINAGESKNGYVGYYANEVVENDSLIHVNEDDNHFVTYNDGTDVILLGYVGNDATNVNIPNGITIIENRIFNDRNNIRSISIPNTVHTIKEKAFSNCKLLYSITLPESVTTIEEGAFNNCTRLIEVVNHSSLTIEIGKDSNGAIAKYAKQIITNPADSKISVNDNGYTLYTDDSDIILLGYPENEKELVLPEEITQIYDYTMFQHSDIKSIVIPDKITDLKSNLFNDCRKLESIILPDTLKYFSAYIFINLRSLQYNKYDNGYYVGSKSNPYMVFVDPINTNIRSCTLHPDCRFIDRGFENCSFIQSIILSDHLEYIAESTWGTFYDCPSLKFNVYEGIQYLGSENNPYMISMSTLDKTQTSYTLHEDTRFIGKGTFVSCEKMTSLELPNNVKQISSHAFQLCRDLTSISFGSNVKYIATAAFDVCSSLTGITYSGTKEEFESIIKDTSWNGYEGDYVHQIICSDGTIEL